MSGLGKRQPLVDMKNLADDLSKADWIDMYADLYRQTHGDGATDTEIRNDAFARQVTLRSLRGSRPVKEVR